MRHNKKFNHLGRTADHRKALLANMAKSLIQHKRITTTLAKAKALKKFVEPLITRAKDDTTHSRRVVFSYLQDKDNPSVLYKCRGTAVARAFDTQFHVSGMRGKTVDFTLIFPAIPEDYHYLNFIEVGSKEDRLSQSGYHFKSDLEPQTPAIRQ